MFRCLLLIHKAIQTSVKPLGHVPEMQNYGQRPMDNHQHEGQALNAKLNEREILATEAVKRIDDDILKHLEETKYRYNYLESSLTNDKTSNKKIETNHNGKSASKYNYESIKKHKLEKISKNNHAGDIKRDLHARNKRDTPPASGKKPKKYAVNKINTGPRIKKSREGKHTKKTNTTEPNKKRNKKGNKKSNKKRNDKINQSKIRIVPLTSIEEHIIFVPLNSRTERNNYELIVEPTASTTKTTKDQQTMSEIAVTVTHTTPESTNDDQQTMSKIPVTVTYATPESTNDDQQTITDLPITVTHATPESTTKDQEETYTKHNKTDKSTADNETTVKSKLGMQDMLNQLMPEKALFKHTQKNNQYKNLEQTRLYALKIMKILENEEIVGTNNLNNKLGMHVFVDQCYSRNQNFFIFLDEIVRLIYDQIDNYKTAKKRYEMTPKLKRNIAAQLDFFSKNCYFFVDRMICVGLVDINKDKVPVLFCRSNGVKSNGRKGDNIYVEVKRNQKSMANPELLSLPYYDIDKEMESYNEYIKTNIYQQKNKESTTLVNTIYKSIKKNLLTVYKSTKQNRLEEDMAYVVLSLKPDFGLSDILQPMSNEVEQENVMREIENNTDNVRANDIAENITKNDTTDNVATEDSVEDDVNVTTKKNGNIVNVEDVTIQVNQDIIGDTNTTPANGDRHDPKTNITVKQKDGNTFKKSNDKEIAIDYNAIIQISILTTLFSSLIGIASCLA